MLKVFVISILCLACSGIWAQETTGSDFFNQISISEKDTGSLVIFQEPGIEELVGIHIDANKRNKGIDGFRIQLYLGSNKNAKKEATDVKGKLLSLFPEEHPYIMYKAPFWRVQVGDFRSKNESLELYRKLRKEFPSCYPVPVNNISLSSLK
ncbi:SPOR domain-containing protein [Labilibacter marinus]|uniref:SPOR domain-containing protein n=1 Tax=Labilibacter marinus TaxID=1477105 RepID=UPI00094FAEE7|nr:SPOR domain-containing protein [Labilibacter marinus]